MPANAQIAREKYGRSYEELDTNEKRSVAGVLVRHLLCMHYSAESELAPFCFEDTEHMQACC